MGWSPRRQRLCGRPGKREAPSSLPPWTPPCPLAWRKPPGRNPELELTGHQESGPTSVPTKCCSASPNKLPGISPGDSHHPEQLLSKCGPCACTISTTWEPMRMQILSPTLHLLGQGQHSVLTRLAGDREGEWNSRPELLHCAGGSGWGRCRLEWC